MIQQKLKVGIITLFVIISIISCYLLIKNNNFKAKAEVVTENNLEQENVKLTGDVNGDGLINASDAANILTISSCLGVKKEPTIEYDEEVADVDKNGTIDANDAAIILQYSSKIGVGAIDRNVTIEEYLENFE